RAPERVTGLVYLDAFVPEDGQSLHDVFRPPHGEGVNLEALLVNGWRLPYPFLERPFGITSTADTQWGLDKITPQPVETLLEPIHFTNGGAPTIPRTYIYLRSPDGQPADTEFVWFAERARTQPGWTYHELVSGHDAMIIIPEAVVALLLEAAPG